VLPGEFVIERGDPHRELVVLTKGICHSVPDTEDSGLVSKRMESTPGVEIVIEYPSGSFFGELEFLGFGSERLVSVRTKTFCEVSSLHPDDMEEVLRVHVKLRRRLERYGQLKQELATALSKNEGGEMTAEDEFAVELVKQKIEDGWLDENVELRRVFESVDSDGSGALDREEIRGLSVSMGKPITDRELELVMRTMDTDGGGTVSFEEFAAWWDENDGSFKMATKSTVAMETQMRQMKELHEESLDGAMAKMKAELDTMNSRMIRTEDAVARIEANLDRVVQAVCK
jgi:CRP-like cAMP-binding protein